MLTGFPPLSLYVHLPWCVRKCPYCDFNSHNQPGELPLDEYAAALLKDLDYALPEIWGRPVQSIFFGGGTPSLFSARWYESFISEVRARLMLVPEVEITIEANPGTTEHDSFPGYADAGINRVSLGVQSFQDNLLKTIGRIHGSEEVLRSLDSIRRSGITNFNIDLMFAQPGQSLEMAIDDIEQAIAAGPAHISHYQLTIEPNTAFHARPPELPNPDDAWAMQEAAALRLQKAGFQSYEISAWAIPGQECRHNLNYWQYGDFLGIGAGAHSKISLPSTGRIRRYVRQRHPRGYLGAEAPEDFLLESRDLDAGDLIFEFFLNQLRLQQGVSKSQFTARTGLPWSSVEKPVERAVSKGLLAETADRLEPTELGWRFSNETQALFLPEKS